MASTSDEQGRRADSRLVQRGERWAPYVTALETLAEAEIFIILAVRARDDEWKGVPYTFDSERYEAALADNRQANDLRRSAGRAYRTALTVAIDVPQQLRSGVYWRLDQPGGGPFLLMEYLPQAAYELRKVAVKIEAWTEWDRKWTLRGHEAFIAPDPTPEALLDHDGVDPEALRQHAIRVARDRQLSAWEIWVLLQAGTVTVQDLTEGMPGLR